MPPSIPGSNLPGITAPYTWDLVKVLDPRIEGRTMVMYLMTKEVRVPDIEKKATTSGAIPFKVRKVVVSPMISYDDPNAVYEIMHFTVVDPRFAPSTVQVCFTLQEAMAFRQSMVPTQVARAMVASGQKFMRFKCYLSKCVATSSKMEKIRAHFLSDHPYIPFEPQKVRLYQFGGSEDPSIIRSSSAKYNTLPPLQASTLVTSFKNNPLGTKTQAQFNNVTASTSLKRRRAPGVTDLRIPTKVPRLADGERSIARAIALAKANMAPSTGGHSTGRANQPSVEGYLHKHPVTTQVPAEDQELLCLCLKPEDGKPKIECANGKECLLRWYHLECIGLAPDNLPKDDEVWYCGRCIDQGIGGAANLSPIESAPSRVVIQPQSISQLKADEGKGKGKAAAYSSPFSRNAEIPMPSPSVHLKPWSADLDKSFANNPHNVKDFNLESIQHAKDALLSLAAAPLGQPRSQPSGGTPRVDQWGRAITPAGTLKTPNSRSWTTEEEQHLKEVVAECVAQGLSGEPLWRAAHPKLLSRGVNRAVGGMKMRWCRGLREETKIDERRKKNNHKMLTALQGPKVNHDPNTPKKGRFKGKGMHGTATSTTASSPIRKSTNEVSASTLATTDSSPVRDIPSFNSLSSNVEDEMSDVRDETPGSIQSEESAKGDFVQGAHRRTKSV